MDNYIFIRDLDQLGNELLHNNSSIENNIKLANSIPNCFAINSSGSFKSSITNLIAGVGIYIKKEAFQEYINKNKWIPAPIIDFKNYGLPVKEKVKGIILVVSCQKYMQTRVEEFKLSKLEYSDWKVITVIGDTNLNTDCSLETTQNDVHLLTIKCEDTYIYIIKKLSFTMKCLLSIFDIEEGILRLGDDIEIDEPKMENFLINVPKVDYMGWCGYIYEGREIITKYPTYFMQDYYAKHLDELKKSLLTNEELKNMNVVPTTRFTEGTIVYYSLKSCQCLIQEMEKMKWDLFYYHELYGYVNIIEDIGVSCLLYNNQIFPTMYMFHSGSEQKRIGPFDESTCIGKHTNKYKDD